MQIRNNFRINGFQSVKRNQPVEKLQEVENNSVPQTNNLPLAYVDYNINFKANPKQFVKPLTNNEFANKIIKKMAFLKKAMPENSKNVDPISLKLNDNEFVSIFVDKTQKAKTKINIKDGDGGRESLSCIFNKNGQLINGTLVNGQECITFERSARNTRRIHVTGFMKNSTYAPTKNDSSWNIVLEKSAKVANDPNPIPFYREGDTFPEVLMELAKLKTSIDA